MKIHGDRRDPSGGRGTAPIGGDGECPGGNPRARWRPTDMEAGAGWRGGADGRKGIHTHSISVEHADTGGGDWGGRGRSSEYGRGGWQARREGAARGVAGPGTAAGGRAIRGSVSTIAQHGTPTDNKGTRLVGGQDNGELSDVSQKYGTTPGTASAVFPRLGYRLDRQTRYGRATGTQRVTRFPRQKKTCA